MSRVWAITRFQGDAPHWEIALIEAEDEQAAKAALLAILTDDAARPGEVWGWDDDISEGDYRDPATWRVQEAETPLRFVLGGGCR